MTVDLDKPTMQRLRDECDQPPPLFEPDRPCEVCSNPLVRRKNETRRDFAKRVVCSVSCSMNRIHSLAGTAVTTPEEKPCAFCRKTMQKRKGESRSRWAARDVCDMSCASQRKHMEVYSALPQTKPCEECAETMVWDHAKTAPGRWKTLRFCSKSCVNSSQKKRKRDEPVAPKPPPVTPKPPPPPPKVVDPDAPPAAPPWRPAGWTAWPNVWAGHKPYSDEVA